MEGKDTTKNIFEILERYDSYGLQDEYVHAIIRPDSVY
jgi:hypothetical protein